ncbi:MAG: molecular chaperone HtpG [Myxococcales bacterium]|nr:molecular chaperone HtpG [Myxococcales bacterium]
MTQGAERHEFQAEVKQLLDLMVHSLYSDKDIFLRELVSNASDALDKRRFEQVARPELADAAALEIHLAIDAAARTLTISDNGIGMSRDEVVKNIGTIARSGTKEFLAQLKAAAATDAPGLIGQFGVGFYSAFMVADRITLVTRKAGADGATRWESTGDGTYTIEDGERATAGTSITLHLKPADPEHGLHDYATESVLATIVKRYSDFVGYPIRMAKADGELGEPLNSRNAIWDRPKAEVTEQEYQDFYRHVSHDWTDPLRSIPLRMEGTFEAYALLFLPAKAPFDLYSPEMKRGLQLYVKRVFVMDECKELLPTHLRFVRGVVDAHDLSLNVSREILQKDRQIQLIKKQLVKKVLGALDEMKRDKPDDYRTFWAAFGPVLKEGLAGWDTQDKDKLLDLVVTHSTKQPDGLVSFADYVGRMKEGQDAIYYLTGASKDAVARSPLLERFATAGHEVLLFSDPIDELWLENAPRFGDKPLVSIARGDIKLGSDEERQAEEAKRDERNAELADLLIAMRAALQDDVKDVRLSTRLTTSPSCLVADADDMTPRMQRMMAQLGHAVPAVKPVLELNGDHALIGKLRVLRLEHQDDPRIGWCARVLLGQAQLADAGEVAAPEAYNQAVAELMLRAV